MINVAVAVVLAGLCLSSGAELVCGSYICVEITSGVFNVLQYGAKGDGKTLDTSAIQAAFNAAKSNNGGTVYFPSGYEFLTGPFVIESSNTAIFVDASTSVIAMNDTKTWPQSLGGFITCNHVNNIVLMGTGTINGQGSAWWPNPNGFRPLLVQLQNTVNLLVVNLTFIDSPSHNLELYANFTELYQVTVLAPGDSPNTDAVDVHGSPFYIHNCYFSVGDDNVAQHTNDTLVHDCYFGTGHGASIGSVDVGFIQNVTFRNIVFNGTENGARIKTDVGGSGFVRNITWENIVMYDVDYTIYITMYYATNPGQTSMHISDITFRNITSYNSNIPGYFDCMPSLPCTNIEMDQVIQHGVQGAFSCQNAFGTMSDVAPPACLQS